MRDVAIAEANALTCQPIQMRRGNVFAALEPKVGIALVIGDDDQQIGRRLRAGGWELSQDWRQKKS